MALQALEPFCTWLAATSVSQTIQAVEWIIPAVQTIHILAVSFVVTAAVMVDLRLLGVGAPGRPLAVVARRFLPSIWWALPVLLATGAILIVAEPARSLQNPVFLLKMALLLVAALVTLILQVPLRRDSEFWELSSSRLRAGRVLALASIPLWVGIIFAGRWIAYVQG